MAGLIAKATNASTPDGKYFGVLIGVYDIGTQPSDKYEPNHQVIMTWELHNKRGPVLTKEGNPLRHSEFFTLAFGQNRQTKEKSKLRKLVEGMLDRAFTEAEAKDGYDLFELVGVASRLQILEGRISAISQLDEDDRVPETESDEVAYLLDPNAQIPTSVPEWVVTRIKKSQEWTRVHGKDDGSSASSGNGSKSSKPAKATAGASKSKGKPQADENGDDDESPF